MPAPAPANGAAPGRSAPRDEFTYSLARIAPGFVRRRRAGFINQKSPRGTDLLSEKRTCSRVVLLFGQVSTMILPQVHLRKPCYDFSFL